MDEYIWPRIHLESHLIISQKTIERLRTGGGDDRPAYASCTQARYPIALNIGAFILMSVNK